MKLIPPARRKRAHLSQLTTTHFHLRHPLVVAFFSFSFPGFGNLMQQRYATAFMLILWELFINTKAHINTGILYSLLGDFEKAKAVLDERWLMFYVAIYMYSIWDSYRGSVDMNKLYLLADREDAPISSIPSGIVLLIRCDEQQWPAVEQLLRGHHALGLAGVHDKQPNR
ncbi:hypothetical protein [Geobacillus zalihae]|uniref:hypothetical protein n=1 Tax=Geobacillus zalihae TaxID=213419 RepID=UPI00167FF4F0|nr:hypothetical protein [Geobacillus zalihae]QNU25017.1 hypothetical protein IC806_01435 [Geobacillus zalihae]